MKRIAFAAILMGLTAGSLWLFAAVAQSGDTVGAVTIAIVMPVLIGSLATSPLEKRNQKAAKPKAAPEPRRLGKATNEWRSKKRE